MTEPRGQVGRARSGRVMWICRGEQSHGPPMRLRPRWLSNVGNVAATWHGARCARVRERRNAGTVFAFLALGVGTIPPAPRHVTCGVPVGWSQTCVPVYRYAVVWFPHVLIMLPLLRPFRRSLSARTKARCQPVVIVSHRAPFPPCQVWRALSPIIARA